MSSTVTIIFAITRVVNNYNIRTEPCFFEPNRTKLIPNRIRVFFKNRTESNLTRTRHYSMEMIHGMGGHIVTVERQ